MSKFIKGELAQDWFGKTVVFLNYCIAGADCIVYNPKRDVFEVLDSRKLKPVDRYYFHTHVINVENGINSIREEFEFKIFELYHKALPVAERHLYLFKSLEGCTLDLSDSVLLVESVELADDMSYDWKDLIIIGGTRTRDGISKHFETSVNALKPNNRTIQHMVETNALP